MAILMIPLAMRQCWKVQVGPSVQVGRWASTAFISPQWGSRQSGGGEPVFALSLCRRRQVEACLSRSLASTRAVSRSRADGPLLGAREGGRGWTEGSRGGLTPPRLRRGLSGGLW